MISVTWTLGKPETAVIEDLGPQPGDLAAGEIAEVLLPWVMKNVNQDNCEIARLRARLGGGGGSGTAGLHS